MKRVIVFILLLIPACSLWAYKITFAEQFYKLYHQHFYYYPEDSAENLYYLNMALHSDFANPLNALAEIGDEEEWEKYRYLFYMHINLRIVDTYIKLASKYDKFEAHFYNYPWKYVNLESLDIAQGYYENALYYWVKAEEWSEEASLGKFRWMYLEEISFWEDENARIQDGDLDYQEIIEHHLQRLEQVREAFQKMDENTY